MSNGGDTGKNKKKNKALHQSLFVWQKCVFYGGFVLCSTGPPQVFRSTLMKFHFSFPALCHPSTNAQQRACKAPVAFAETNIKYQG